MYDTKNGHIVADESASSELGLRDLKFEVNKQFDVIKSCSTFFKKPTPVQRCEKYFEYIVNEINPGISYEIIGKSDYFTRDLHRRYVCHNIKFDAFLSRGKDNWKYFMQNDSIVYVYIINSNYLALKNIKTQNELVLKYSDFFNYIDKNNIKIEIAGDGFSSNRQTPGALIYNDYIEYSRDIRKSPYEKMEIRFPGSKVIKADPNLMNDF